MKIATLALLFLGTIFASAQVPNQIPFGKSIVTKALAEVVRGTTVVSGEGLSKTSQLSFAFAPVDSVEELGNIVRGYRPSVRAKNPLKVVFVRSALMDATGKERLVAHNSFKHVVKRESGGRKTYVVPKSARNLYFEVAEQSFAIPDAETAVAVSVDGNVYELSVLNGLIKVPSFIASNPEYWNYIQVNLKGGQIVQYDQSGTRLQETVDLFSPEYVGVQSIYQESLQDENTLDTILSPQYGWNPLVQFTNAEKQFVTIKVRTYDWARPTYVRIYTLDQERAGTKPDWIEYNPENSDEYQETIQVPLEPGTYFMEAEWPTWMQYETGGKG